MRISGALIGAILFVAPFGVIGNAQAQEVPPDNSVISLELEAELASLGRKDRIPVIISFEQSVRPENFRQTKRSERRARLVEALRAQSRATTARWTGVIAQAGGRKSKPLWVRNAIAVELSANSIARLAGLRGIRRIDFDATILATDTTVAAQTQSEWNIDLINAPALWQLGVTGAGATVASMDTGADALHLDLKSSQRTGLGNWFDPHGVYATPHDSSGHGTQTIGLMVGGDATGSRIGVAPDANWIAAKIFNDADQAQISDIELAFQWLLDPDGNPQTDDAPDVVNNSWGYSAQVNECNPIFQESFDLLRAANVAVVFAAGNTGPGVATSISPANTPGAFAVGSVDDVPSLNVSSFSARGPGTCTPGIAFPAVVAPGRNIKTADLTFGFNPQATIIVSGTSFAAPQVAGALALLASAFPEKTVDELEAALRSSARDLGPAGADNDYGAGVIDVRAAYVSLGGVAITDSDGDGVGIPDDCNDNDASIHPGANEVVGDGIDQDCNGFDLTISMPRARFMFDQDKVVVFASSSLADPADFNALKLHLNFLDGSTSRDWQIRFNTNTGRWQRSIGGVSTLSSSEPVSVTVWGSEGSLTSVLEVTGVPPVDNDGDGVTSDFDCNDSDPSIYPGAPEIARDGVDQDCNGTDLTILIDRAWFYPDKDRVVVYAWSDVADQNKKNALRLRIDFADGSFVDNLAIQYNVSNNRWQRAITGVAAMSTSAPVSVTVRGAEGAETQRLTTK